MKRKKESQFLVKLMGLSEDDETRNQSNYYLNDPGVLSHFKNKRVYKKLIDDLSPEHNFLYSYEKIKGKGFVAHQFIKNYVSDVTPKKTANVLPTLPANHYYHKLIPKYINLLEGNGYSENTIKTYQSLLFKLVYYFKDRNIAKLSEKDLEQYNKYLIEEKNVSDSYLNQTFNAIKFYYEQIVGKPKKIYQEKRPKRNTKLPTILSEKEIKKLLKKVTNVKHKSLLCLIYSAGLTLSEVINLKKSDIDTKNMVIRVKQSKNPRTTILSEKLIELLQEYFHHYKPSKWVFEGRNGSQYNKRSVEKVFEENYAKINLDKKATVQTLRHSFAVHLLERGTDIKYVQNLMGHNTMSSIRIYKKISDKGMQKVKSPIDYLNL